MVAAGIAVEIHDYWFRAPGVPDPVWLKFVGRKSWIALTKDDRIRYDELSKKAIIARQVRLFTLTRCRLTGPEIGAVFVSALRKMERVIAREAAPFLAYVTRSGEVSKILRLPDLLARRGAP